MSLTPLQYLQAETPGSCNAKGRAFPGQDKAVPRRIPEERQSHFDQQ